MHVPAPGSFQARTRTSPTTPTGDLWHRVNILVYLNPGWRSEWGGELEPRDTAMTTCHERVELVGGRVIIFEPGPDALHGIPAVRCPVGDARHPGVHTTRPTPVPTPGDATRR